MTPDQADDAIKRRFLLAWPTASAAVAGYEIPTLLDNERTVPPPVGVTWCELYVEGGRSLARTIGRPMEWETLSTIVVNLYYPAAGAGGASDGTKLLGLLARVVADVLANVQFDEGPDEDGVVTQGASPQRVGNTDDDEWWMLAVLVPFTYTEIR